MEDQEIKEMVKALEPLIKLFIMLSGIFFIYFVIIGGAITWATIGFSMWVWTLS